jgi:glycosyltransferase involved in cell wall biosynthesis
MHICFITSEFPAKGISTGGIGSVVKFLGEKLVKKNITVSVVGIYDIQLITFEEIDNIKVYRLPKSKWKFAKFDDNTKKILKKINEINSSEKIDIVEGSELSFAFFPTKNSYKKVIRLHGGHHFFAIELNKKPAFWRSYQEKKSFKKADEFIAVSDYVGNQTKKHLNIDFNFSTIYNTVDTDKFKNNNPLEFKKNSLLFVGTICEKKGVRQLVQAIPIIKEQFPDIVLNIIGRDWKFPDGKSYIEYLKTFILDEDKNNINIIGPVDHMEVPSYLKKTDICVYPSHMEAMPIAWLEGLSMGKKVVASRIGPGLELIKDNETGLLIDPYSPEDIAEKIIQALTNTKEAEKRAVKAREDILRRFNSDLITNQNIEFYKSIL